MRAHALSRGGAAAAWAVGTLTYASGGWAFTLILLAFFLPSVALSRVGRAGKKQLVDIGKGGARDGWQVLANGGIATLCAMIAGLAAAGALPSTIDAMRWIAAFAGSYAAATADTWGTEIGTLVRGRPHSILTFRPIATGLSGGVTWAGTAAEIAGAAWMAAVAVAAVALLLSGHTTLVRTNAALSGLFVAVLCGGVAGAVADSLLGATLQELRQCPRCDRTCETNPHVCGTPTTLLRGVAGFSNDAVNGAATAIGALVAYATSVLALAIAAL